MSKYSNSDPGLYCKTMGSDKRIIFHIPVLLIPVLLEVLLSFQGVSQVLWLKSYVAWFSEPLIHTKRVAALMPSVETAQIYISSKVLLANMWLLLFLLFAFLPLNKVGTKEIDNTSDPAGRSIVLGVYFAVCLFILFFFYVYRNTFSGAESFQLFRGLTVASSIGRIIDNGFQSCGLAVVAFYIPLLRHHLAAKKLNISQ